MNAIDAERARQGLSKAELARLAGLPAMSVRRLLTQAKPNPGIATAAALARPLGLELKLVPAPPTQRELENAALAQERIARRVEAEKIARKHGVDAGDVEHVLFNLTLPPIERLRRSLRRGRLKDLAVIRR